MQDVLDPKRGGCRHRCWNTVGNPLPLKKVAVDCFDWLDISALNRACDCDCLKWGIDEDGDLWNGWVRRARTRRWT